MCHRCVTSLVVFDSQLICVYEQHHAACMSTAPFFPVSLGCVLASIEFLSLYVKLADLHSFKSGQCSLTALSFSA